MNGAHLHLIICHIPIIGAGFTTLLIVFGLFQKSKEVKRTSLWFALITGVSALITYMTGDSAEEIVKTIPGITESLIDPHESMAMFYMISLLLIGAVALAGLFLSRASSDMLHKFTIIVLVLNILVTFLAYKTGLTGGKIRHTEIENTTQVKN
jgi:uncharacterized membrane protein